jgi:hypothetical protein
MAGIDDVLERLLSDAGFARQLAQHPAVALAGYELNEDDLSLLSTQVSFDRGAVSGVEERVSKAGMFGLLSTFTAGLGSLGGPDTIPTGLGGPDTAPVGLGGPDMVPAVESGPGDESPGIILLDAPADPGGPGDEQGIIINWTPGEDADHSGGGGGGAGLGGPDTVPAVQSGPGDESQGIIIHGTPGAGGEEVAIKEVDPAPAPSLDDPGALHGFDPQPDPPGGTDGIIINERPGETHGIIIDTSIGDPNQTPGGGGGGGGEEVAIKEVDPAPAPSLDNPGAARGFDPQPDPPGVPVGGLHAGEESGIIVYD